MKRKVFSLFVVLTVLISMMPSAILVSHAAGVSKVEVSSGPDLKQYLESSGNYDITLTKDIDYSKHENYDVWCTVSGKKALDLNGHSLVVHNNDVDYSTLFSVPANAEMTVYDTKNSDSSIRYNGYINENGDLKYRNIFSVGGKLTVNGGKIEGGRSKSEYSAYYAKNIWKQTFATGIEVMSGGVLTVNGGMIIGRGAYLERESGIHARSGSSVYFNRGSVAAKGGASCFSGGGNVYVATGTFTCETLDAVEIDGKSTKGYGYGKVGLRQSSLASCTLVDKKVPSDASCDTARELVLKPGQEYVTLYANSGTMTAYNDKNETDMCIPTTDPVISARQVTKGTPFGNQFKNIDTSLPGNSYGIWYSWSVWDLYGKKLAETAQLLSKSSVNVMKDFSGFTPEKGKKYIIHCQFRETLLDTSFDGIASNSTFTVLDDLAAPVITENPQTKIEVKPGASASMSVKATGTNLKYAWETSANGGNTWVPCTTGTGYNSADYTTAALSKDDNGVMFRCRVYNNAGSVYSWMVTVAISADKTVSAVNFTNFTVPKNGGKYTSDVTVSSDFPGKITHYTFAMFNKDVNGTVAYAGENVAFCVYVDLNSGYQWAADKTAYLNGKPQDATVHNDSMGTEYGFVWNFTIGYTDKIQINSQSPETVEYVNGEDVTLYVNATGATGYQWCGSNATGSSTSGSGAKQKYSRTEIAGATSNTYTITKADSSLDGSQYQCILSCSEGTINSKIFTLKLVDKKTHTNPFVDIYESDEYYDAVLWAYYASPQVTNGMDETHFGPHLTVTRAQAVTFLWRSQGCPEPSTTVNPFVDVPSTEYYYKPVLWAVENEITKGVDETHFNPKDTLSTLHMITFLYRTKNPGMDGWNGEAAAWAADENGEPFGVDIAVNNDTDCPRADVVLFLYRCNGQSSFDQQYWVIFTEGYRGNRVEAATIDSTLSSDKLKIIWDTKLELNDSSGSGKCDQYYLNKDTKWVKMGKYDRFSENATKILASNLDVYDKDGNLILKKTAYKDIDWGMIKSYS